MSGSESENTEYFYSDTDDCECCDDDDDDDDDDDTLEGGTGCTIVRPGRLTKRRRWNGDSTTEMAVKEVVWQRQGPSVPLPPPMPIPMPILTRTRREILHRDLSDSLKLGHWSKVTKILSDLSLRDISAIVKGRDIFGSDDGDNHCDGNGNSDGIMTNNNDGGKNSGDRSSTMDENNAEYNDTRDRSLLHDACLLNAPPNVVEALLQADPSENFHGETRHGRTPLHLVFEGGPPDRCLEIVCLLLHHHSVTDTYTGTSAVASTRTHTFTDTDTCINSNVSTSTSTNISTSTRTRIKIDVETNKNMGTCVGTRSLVRPMVETAASVADANGELPLHLACQLLGKTTGYVRTCVIKELLMSYPQGLIQTDKSNQRPLDYLDYEQIYDLYKDGTEEIINQIGNLFSFFIAKREGVFIPSWKQSSVFEYDTTVAVNVDAQSTVDEHINKIETNTVVTDVKEQTRARTSSSQVYVRRNDSKNPLNFNRKRMEEILHVCPWAFHTPDGNGFTPLHKICYYFSASKDSAEALLFVMRAYPNAVMMQNRHGKTPLHTACENRMMDRSCYESLSNEASTNGVSILRAAAVPDGKGRLPIHLLCRFSPDAIGEDGGFLDVIVDAYPTGMTHRDVDGKTPLHHVCSCPGSSFKKILDYNENAVGISDHRGYLPAHTLCDEGWINRDGSTIVRPTLAGSNHPHHAFNWSSMLDHLVMADGGDALIQGETSLGDTPLHLACRERSFKGDGYQSLIRLCPRALAVRNHHGDLPLHLACKINNINVKCRPPNMLNRTENFVYFPHSAKKASFFNWELSVGNFLMVLRKYPNAMKEKNAEGFTPLDVLNRRLDTFASEVFFQKAEALLVKSRRDRVLHLFLEIESCSDEIAYSAVRHWFRDQFRLDKSGRLPVHIESGLRRPNGGSRCLSLLLKNGKNYMKRDGNGNYPLHYILRSGRGWEEGVIYAIKTCPIALVMGEIAIDSTLYPQLLSRGASGDQSCLTLVFNLLKHTPHLISM